MTLSRSDFSQASAGRAPDRPDAAVAGGWCGDCEYPLRGLTDSTHCPECDRPFDPPNPETMETRPPVGLLGKWFRRNPGGVEDVAFGTWMAATLVLIVVWGSIVSGAPFVFGLPLVFLGAARVRAAVRRNVVARYGLPGVIDEHAFVFRGVAWAALALFAGITFHCQRCPHGTSVGVLGVGVAHSETGGPCRRTKNLTAKRVSGNWYVWVAV